MNNKRIGSDFERRYAAYLKKLGFWVHFLSPAPDGSQPFDFIALKGEPDGTYRIIAADCKTCNTNRFSLDRIEDNQVMAFTQLINCGISHCAWIIVETQKNHIIAIPADHVLRAKVSGVKSINLTEYDNNDYSTNIQ